MIKKYFQRMESVYVKGKKMLRVRKKKEIKDHPPQDSPREGLGGVHFSELPKQSLVQRTLSKIAPQSKSTTRVVHLHSEI